MQNAERKTFPIPEGYGMLDRQDVIKAGDCVWSSSEGRFIVIQDDDEYVIGEKAWHYTCPIRKYKEVEKVYIAGQIKGLPREEAASLFAKAAEFLRSKGCLPMNPMEITPENSLWLWQDYMRADIKTITECDSMFMLSNWQNSKGAKGEHFIAKELLKMPIMYEADGHE